MMRVLIFIFVCLLALCAAAPDDLKDEDLLGFISGMESMINADMTEYARKIKEPSRFVEEMMADGLKPDQDVTIETATGPKTMKAKDLLKRMKDMERSAEKLKNENGNLIGEDSGTVSIDELDKEENAHVKRFMSLGQYAHAVIQTVGYGQGKLKNIQSSPRFEQVVKERMKSKDYSAPQFPTLIVLSVEEEGGKVKKYEIELEMDKKYAKPHVALINGWLIEDGSGEDLPRGKEMILPYPTLAPQLFGYDVETLETASIQVGGLLVCVGTVAFLSAKFLEEKGREKKE